MEKNKNTANLNTNTADQPKITSFYPFSSPTRSPNEVQRPIFSPASQQRLLPTPLPHAHPWSRESERKPHATQRFLPELASGEPV